MIKALVGITALLVGLTGPQAPAHAYCSLSLDSYEYGACLDNEQRMDQIERRQREIQDRQDCISSGYEYCF